MGCPIKLVTGLLIDKPRDLILDLPKTFYIAGRQILNVYCLSAT